MNLYSPKVQNPENFKKNTIKNNYSVNVNKKAALATGRTVIFEMNKKGSKSDSKKKHIPILDLLKVKIYEKLKIFFEYEENL